MLQGEVERQAWAREVTERVTSHYYSLAVSTLDTVTDVCSEVEPSSRNVTAAQQLVASYVRAGTATRMLQIQWSLQHCPCLP